jgi:hypothetical protein
VGCSKAFTKRAPAIHCCDFRRSGFLFLNGRTRARPCGVAYHAGCVRVGEPFRTRLADSKGLTLPHHVPMPHFVCEACQVRAELGRELHRLVPDLCLLMLERMRMIDNLSFWAKQMLQKYGPYLRYLYRFGRHFGVRPLQPSPLATPPCSPAVSLQWALLYYSLRTKKGKDGETHRIGFAALLDRSKARLLCITCSTCKTRYHVESCGIVLEEVWFTHMFLHVLKPA